MKYFVATEHVSHFRRNQIIELEGIFTPEQLTQLFHYVEQALQDRLKVPFRLMPTMSPFNKYLAGRDLWRNNAVIRKTVADHNLLETVATLTNQSILRLGYDQYIPTMTSELEKPEDKYVQLFNRQSTVEAISCLQGVVAGAIISLRGERSIGEKIETPVVTEVTAETEKIRLPFLPSKPGNVVIFSGQAELDFTQLLKAYNQEFLLILYTEQKSVYVYRESDPNSTYLRSLGYNLSDRLNDRLHPIIYRR